MTVLLGNREGFVKGHGIVAPLQDGSGKELPKRNLVG